jgi:uncharacterized protein
MSVPFTNIHAHVFNSECAPDNFLRILPMNGVRRAPRLVKNIIDSKSGRTVIHGLFKIFSKRSSDKRSEVDKYVAFLDVGTESSQLEVFRRALQAGLLFDPNVRIVGLTMNMDHMDSRPSRKQISFETQLEEIKAIKRYYPTHFFPFLGIDPRHKGGNELVQWAKPYFESGVLHTPTSRVYPYFCGIKLYPALGFFPFDPRLEMLYQFAESEQLPIMTHCTRVGSQYIGDQIDSLIPKSPAMIDVPGNPAVSEVKASIEKRISDYRQAEWIKNSKIGDNDLACDLFGHPENYVPLLEKFPNLKVCLAHMGGSNEILKSRTGNLSAIRNYDPMSWFEHIERMMKKYPNLYTDISYTLSDFKGNKEVLMKTRAFLDTDVQPNDVTKGKLGDRVLFGTDFFMTEQEKREQELYANTQETLIDWWDKMGRTNPQKFLMQPF